MTRFPLPPPGSVGRLRHAARNQCPADDLILRAGRVRYRVHPSRKSVCKRESFLVRIPPSAAASGLPLPTRPPDPRSMPPPPLTIHLFGRLRVTVAGEPLPRVRTRSVEWLLALLTLRHGRAVNRAWLAGTLWPESSGSQALENLRADLVRPRKSLGPESGRIRSPGRDSLTLDLAGAAGDVRPCHAASH